MADLVVYDQGERVQYSMHSGENIPVGVWSLRAACSYIGTDEILKAPRKSTPRVVGMIIRSVPPKHNGTKQDRRGPHLSCSRHLSYMCESANCIHFAAIDNAIKSPCPSDR